MLSNLLAASGFGQAAMSWIKAASLVIEVLAVVIIISATLFTLGRYLLRALLQRGQGDPHHELQHGLARSLLVGLEVLVAADVVRTVAMELTFESVAVLGLLVLIRTFLGWALIVELQGRWPWQPAPAAATEQSVHPPTYPPPQAHSGELR